MNRRCRIVADRALQLVLLAALAVLGLELARRLAVAGLGIDAEAGVGGQGKVDVAVRCLKGMFAVGKGPSEVDGAVGGVGLHGGVGALDRDAAVAGVQIERAGRSVGGD